MHPDYYTEGGGTHSFSIRNDIALLKLNEYLDYNQLQQAGAGTVCLPTNSMPVEADVTVLGWGDQHRINVPGGLPFSDFLQQIFDQSPFLKEV